MVLYSLCTNREDSGKYIGWLFKVERDGKAILYDDLNVVSHFHSKVARVTAKRG